MNRLDAPDSEIPAETIRGFIILGGRLAAQMAEANFRIITGHAGWTLAEVEAEVEWAIARMDVGARDLLAAKGADSCGENWQLIWTAMEAGYRDTTTVLLRASGLLGRHALQ